MTMEEWHEIDRNTLQQWEENDHPHLLIDVREADERARWHIGGRHIPLDEIVRRRGEIDPDVPTVFYCRKGIRSQIAIQRLRRFYPDADMYNLIGGIGESER
ncbi:MAG TPA: rhodanese-like domain-containing protein [Saprospiraceae bacterium]|nr:rhodanese-like domain-containing protein [Saprospiraceae bacterium]